MHLRKFNRLLPGKMKYILCIFLGIIGLLFYNFVSADNETPSLHTPYRDSGRSLKELGTDNNTPLPNSAPLSNDGVKKIVLVAYYRGGSSFLGELFNQNPAAFYWFEPLAYPVYHLSRQLGIKSDQFIVSNNGTFRNLSSSMTKDLAKVLLNILNCDLGELDRHVLSHYFLTEWGKSLRGLPYAVCLKQYPGHSPFTVPTCLPWLQEACQTSKLRVLKTIRLPAYLAAELAATDPTIKFIYYHRDPRAMLVSRSKFMGAFDITTRDDVEREVIKLCAWSRHDQLGFKTFAQGFHKPLILRYEDFAANPLDTAREVYQYSGVSFPKLVSTWLKKHTNASTWNGPLGTTRNSQRTASFWKTSMNPLVEDVMATHCSDVLQSQGYQ